MNGLKSSGLFKCYDFFDVGCFWILDFLFLCILFFDVFNMSGFLFPCVLNCFDLSPFIF